MSDESDNQVLGYLRRLEQKVDHLDQKVDRTAADLTTLRVAVMNRFDRMETRLTTISDDMLVTIGRADRAHTAADNVRDDIRALSAELAVLHRKTLRLEAQVHDLTRPA